MVCVDDGSRDHTDEVALRAGAHVVRHPVNLGQGAAIQTGVEYARSRPGAAVFATFDADGQHQVKDVVRMIDRLSAEDVDLVIGTRFADPGVVSGTPPIKRLVLRAAAWLSPRSRRLGLTDAHNGLRVFNKTVADGLNYVATWQTGMFQGGDMMEAFAAQAAKRDPDYQDLLPEPGFDQRRP